MKRVNPNISRVIYSLEAERALKNCKEKDSVLFRMVCNAMERVIQAPLIGKPLRHTLRSCRRVHVGSFVLIYELHQEELYFLDFDHHDKIYKKHR